MPKKFIRESSSVSLMSGIKEITDKRGGGNHDFPSRMVFLTVPKHFEGESISVSLVSGIEKCYR